MTSLLEDYKSLVAKHEGRIASLESGTMDFIFTEEAFSRALDASRMDGIILGTLRRELEVKDREIVRLKQLLAEESATSKDVMSDVVTTLLQKNKPDKIIRHEVWRNEHGNSEEGPCFVCRTTLRRDKIWHCSHIEPKCKGGLYVVANLVPCCVDCNSAMRSRNLFEYKASLK